MKKAWFIGVCVALTPVCVVLEWIRFRSPDQALCESCVPACRSFTIVCGVPDRWHRCPVCGVEWYGRKDFGCFPDDGCR